MSYSRYRGTQLPPCCVGARPRRLITSHAWTEFERSRRWVPIKKFHGTSSCPEIALENAAVGYIEAGQAANEGIMTDVSNGDGLTARHHSVILRLRIHTPEPDNWKFTTQTMPRQIQPNGRVLTALHSSANQMNDCVV